MGLIKGGSTDTAQIAKLGDLRQTLFMGNTLRGMLLEAYAFGTMGVIAGYGAIAALVVGLVQREHDANVTPGGAGVHLGLADLAVAVDALDERGNVTSPRDRCERVPKGLTRGVDRDHGPLISVQVPGGPAVKFDGAHV